jgi:GNAT superfamily N-acetyltransferase
VRCKPRGINRGRVMTGKVIQGSFLAGQPKLRPPIPARLPPPIQAKTVARPPGSPAPAAFGRPPAPAFAGRSPVAQPRPPGPPTPAFAGRPPVAQRHGSGGAFAVDPGQLGLASSGGRPLPEAVRGKMEAALGADFSNVRVHVGSQAERIGAIAFTLGSDIYFAPGRFQPDTPHGQQLLGHELAHVVQQRQGRVRNPLGSGLAVVQDHTLESEADRLGRHAAAHRVAALAKMPPGAAQPSASVRISPPISAGPRSYRLTAGAGGHQVGSVMVHARDRGVVEVTDLGVDQTQRGHGIGQMLVASTAKTGLQFGRSKVTLAAQDKGSGHLTQWYKSMGFAQVGVNQRGYPQLEAPISRVLAGTAQRKEMWSRSRIIQAAERTSDRLLAELATPKVFQSPEIEVQKDIVTRLESKSAQMPRFQSKGGKIVDNFLLGGIVLPISTNIVKLIRDAKFVRLKESMVRFDGQDLVANDGYLQKKLVQIMMYTLLTAGQLRYLAKSGLTGGEWRIFIEIHYYRARPQDVSSFHKDTTGRTLFVNLNYATDHEIAGPEYVVKPLPVTEHDDQIKSTLPAKFITDLSKARDQLTDPTEIGATRIPAYGVVSFVDELIHHMTPLYGHRTVYYTEVITFLQQKWSNKYIEAKALYEQFAASKNHLNFYLSSTQEQQIQINLISMLGSIDKSGKGKHLNRKQLRNAGLSDDLIDELMEKFSKSGQFINVYISGLENRRDIVARGTPPLRRRMSEWALRGELPRRVEGDRRFFRSNVQMIKAADLGKIVDKADLKKL